MSAPLPVGLALKVPNDLALPVNFCAKQVKRAGRGFATFKNYRLRVLLYAGGVVWPVTFKRPHSHAPIPTDLGRPVKRPV
jgi:hypothetical protein